MITCPRCRRRYEHEPEVCICGRPLAIVPEPHAAAPEAPAAAPEPAVAVPAAPEPRAMADAGAEITSGDDDEVAPPPTWPPDVPADAIPADPVHLSLRVADGEEDGPAHTSVAAGGRATLFARIRNQSGVVDNYDVRIDGLPTSWWTIVPATVYLLPIGTEGAYEGELQIALHPPRTSEAQAGTWAFDVVASSRAFGRDMASARGTVVIEPFTRLTLAMRPQRVRARRHARVAVAIQNRGNATSDLQLSAIDAEDACRFELQRPAVALGRGEGIIEHVVVRPKRPLIIGRPIDRPFDFTARPAGDEEPVRAAGTFVQRPYLPWWIAVLIPLLALALAMLLMLGPERVDVPKLVGETSVSDAQRKLEEAGLRLERPVEQKTFADDRFGDDKLSHGQVVRQSPPAEEKVAKGAEVSVVVAVGDNMEEIPKVIGLTIAAAEDKLTENSFSIGLTEPSLDPDLVVKSQVPKAGLQRASGTPVNLFLGEPPPPPLTAAEKKKKKEAEAAKKEKAAAAAKKKKEKTKVPKLAGLTRDDSTAALAKAGLQLGAVQQSISTMARGTVVASRPKAGTEVKRGRYISLRISAGFPRLAFGDGRRVLTVGGAQGDDPHLVAGAVPSRQPAWSADGRRIAYVAGGRILMVDSRGRDEPPVALTPAGGDNFAWPTIAPGGVLGFLRARDGDGDLCFARIEGRGATVPRCITDPDVDLSGRPEFSPRGTTILVPGTVAGSGGRRFGIVRYDSATPFSSRPSHWGKGTVVTDASRGGRGVIRAVYSPGGTRLALISNLGERGFRVVLTGPRDFLLRRAEVLPVAACDVDWRPDGLELAVVTGDADCSDRMGNLVRFRTERPDRLRTVRPRASNPVWQPVDLGR